MIILDNHTLNPRPMVATIGFFDGVHQGHRYLIEQVKTEAARRGMQSLLITFGEHPMKVIKPDTEHKMLTVKKEKLRLLDDTGADAVAVLAFTREQSQLSARDFMEKVLLGIYNVRVLLIGHDHHFGHNRSEGFDDYCRYGQELGIVVIQALPLTITDGCSFLPSSTLVRKSLAIGDMATANKVLGYEYFLEGEVVSGFQNGRKIGYPTANISVDVDKLIPAAGVYLVRVGETGDALGTFRYGMLNIGTRPTLDNGDTLSIEVHIFDFQGELYTRSLRVSLIHYIRKEVKFANLAQLKRQLDSDAAVCRRCIAAFSEPTV